jgi:FkbM family methyltransferase
MTPELEMVELPFTTMGGKIPKFYVPRGDIIGTSIRNMRYWDYTFLTNLYSWAAKHGSFLEVGANIGSDTALAREYFPTCHAFEPLSQNRELFTKNMALNGITNFVLYPFAVGDRVEKTRLFLNGSSGNALVQNEPDMQQTEEVDVVTLDAAILTEATNISYLHIDTEGHDIKVLLGARQFIRRQKQRPMIRMEFCPRLLASHGSTIEELLAFIQEFNYTPAMNASIHIGPMSASTLVDFFNLWQSTGAWIDIFLLP